MIVRRFLTWAATASATQRAQGAAALANAWLHADLSDEDRDEADVALTALLDDPAPCVRKALAEVLGPSAGAPHQVIVALANDQSDVSAAVLRYSPLLSDSELIDCAAIGDMFAQSSIALRPFVAAPVAAALAEVGCREALVVLAVNGGANIPDFSARRMVARFGEDAELREALLSRDNLSAAVRSDLVAAAASALSAFVGARGWLSAERMTRIVRESSDRAHLIIASDAGETCSDGVEQLVRHLRASGQLTPSLILRAILSGNRPLYEAAMVDLSGLPQKKALGLARGSAEAFATLYRAARMPAALQLAFAAAVANMPPQGASARLSRLAIERVLAACETINAGELNALLALLRRFEAEAAREDARDAVKEMRAPAVQLLPSFDPYKEPPSRPSRAIEIDLVRFEADLAA